MPTYEYACTNCGNLWEEFQKITEAPVQVCPKCGQSTAKRQLSGGTFILKGGGWYADLYSSSKGGGSKSESSSSSSGSASESKSTSTETKPAATPSGGSSGGSGGSSS
jgi:putative FmdB family regulatory protein